MASTSGPSEHTAASPEIFSAHLQEPELPSHVQARTEANGPATPPNTQQLGDQVRKALLDSELETAHAICWDSPHFQAEIREQRHFSLLEYLSEIWDDLSVQEAQPIATVNIMNLAITVYIEWLNKAPEEQRVSNLLCTIGDLHVLIRQQMKNHGLDDCGDSGLEAAHSHL